MRESHSSRLAAITRKAIVFVLQSGPMNSSQISEKTGYCISSINRHLYHMSNCSPKIVHICDYRFMDENRKNKNIKGQVPAVYELGDFPNVKKNKFCPAESKRFYKTNRQAIIKMRESKRPSPFPT